MIKTTIEMEEYVSVEEIRKAYKEEFERNEAYSEEILLACQNGIPCSYGICDECPNTLGEGRSNDE